MAQLSNYLPWVSFVAGLGGSLHCVGMCGGLVVATCQKPSEVARYQVGRLIGYLFLGLVAGFLGKYLVSSEASPKLSIISGILIGVMFIFWGIESLIGKKLHLFKLKFLPRFHSTLWQKLVQKNNTFSRSFFTGLLSIFLPCGFLYGVVLGAAALTHSYETVLSMFFFWLGTVPSMVLAPSLVRKVINPLKQYLPKTFAVSMIAIGLVTISYRVVKIQQKHSMTKTAPVEEKAHSCH